MHTRPFISFILIMISFPFLAQNREQEAGIREKGNLFVSTGFNIAYVTRDYDSYREYMLFPQPDIGIDTRFRIGRKKAWTWHAGLGLYYGRLKTLNYKETGVYRYEHIISRNLSRMQFSIETERSIYFIRGGISIYLQPKPTLRVRIYENNSPVYDALRKDIERIDPTYRSGSFFCEAGIHFGRRWLGSITILNGGIMHTNVLMAHVSYQIF